MFQSMRELSDSFIYNEQVSIIANNICVKLAKEIDTKLIYN